MLRLDHPQADVLAFHQALGSPWRLRPTCLLPESERALRLSLMQEELHELAEAMQSHDLEQIADGLADLLYVVYGTACTYGINTEPIFKAVHAANMRKLGGGARADGKRLKPAGWQPADLVSILEVLSQRDMA